VTVYTRSLVLSKLKQAFPQEEGFREALALLDTYGTEPYERERERVQIAVIKLSAGDVYELLSYVEAAKADYRDVLAWAEYPEQNRTGASRYNTPPETIAQIEARDRKQYLDWLDGEPPEVGQDSRTLQRRWKTSAGIEGFFPPAWFGFCMN